MPGISDSPILPPHKVSLRTKVSRRLNITEEARRELPPGPNHKTEVTWKENLAAFLRYIDDGFSLCKVNFENRFGFCVNGVSYRVKHAIQSQNIFCHIVKKKR